jgi:putative peptidoglycan binding protein
METMFEQEGFLMKLIFLVLAMAACAGELVAQTQLPVRPITIQNAAPAIARVNPVVIPRAVTPVNPVVHNVTPVRPLSVQQPVVIQPQRLSPAQSRALNDAVRTNNYNLYRESHESHVVPNQTIENQADHIARLQGIIRSGTHPVSIQPGAGLGYNGKTVRQVQTALRQLGYYHGQVDGQFGSSTQDALENYQLNANRPATGLLDRQTLSQLGVEAK